VEETVWMVVRVLAPVALFGTAGMIFWMRIYPGRSGGGTVNRIVWLLMAAFLLADGVWLIMTRGLVPTVN